YELRHFLDQTLWISLFVGVGVACTAVVRIRVLEKRSEEQRERSEATQREMRRLSHELVIAQEEERKRMSRELHDEVGQTLTALRMELMRVLRLAPAGEPSTPARLAECRHL